MSALQEVVHPYIAQERGAGGTRTVIRGTHTPIRTVVGYFKLGYSVEDILEGLPHLTPAQVYDTLSYYYDHQHEVEDELAASQDIKALLEQRNLTVDQYGRISKKNGGA
jgi:uncharacterized protein (DUF433 family)